MFCSTKKRKKKMRPSICCGRRSHVGRTSQTSAQNVFGTFSRSLFQWMVRSSGRMTANISFNFVALSKPMPRPTHGTLLIEWIFGMCVCLRVSLGAHGILKQHRKFDKFYRRSTWRWHEKKLCEAATRRREAPEKWWTLLQNRCECCCWCIDP